MRSLGLTLLALFAAAAAVSAQEAKAQPPNYPPAGVSTLSPENQKLLDACLDQWEKRMKKIDSIELKIVLTEVEAGPPAVKTQYTGDASLLKPNCAKMFLKEATDPTNSRKWRHFVADGQVKIDKQGKES